MINRLFYSTIVSVLLVSFSGADAQKLVSFDSVPGRNPSEHYTCRVKLVSEDNDAWRSVLVLQTEGKVGETGYYESIQGFTASWIAIESDFNGDDVIVEISKKDGSPITEAMVRPVAHASPAVIDNGKAYVTFTEPANVNVDINGQLENNYTGYGYTGPPVHTISLFVNPLFHVPDTSNSSVKVLQPGEDIHALNREEWDTLFFAPGVHDLGMNAGEPIPFQILSNEVLYIPGDAVVHGTIHPKNAWGNDASQNWTVYGSGTISGENITREPSDQANKSTKPFTYQAEGARLEGFVVIDPAFHTFNMNNSRENSTNPNIYKNLKILAWRVNSDGINAFRYSEVSGCFFRVQDDAFYLGAEGVNQHDNVVWHDANGAVLFLQKATDGSTCTFRDVTVIYHRANWHWWRGGRIVSMRETAPGTTFANVHIQNILVEDPLPAFPPFYADVVSGTGPITVSNFVIENVRQLHDGVSTGLDQTRGKPQNTMFGLDADRKWENITFKNCYFNGKWLSSFADGDFDTAFVDSSTVVFELSPVFTKADFKASVSSIAEGQIVNFTDLSSNVPTAWNWSFEGGNPATSTLKNPSVTYDTPGAYNVTLVATNEYGSDTLSRDAYITVTDFIPVTGVSLANCSTSELTEGETYQFNANVLPANATEPWVSWNSSDPSVASVDGNGLVTGLSEGTATITITASDGGFTENCVVNVVPVIINGISLTEEFLKMYPNPAQDQLTVEFTDNANRTIQIFNLVGQLLYQTESIQKQVQIDLRSLGISGQVLIKVRSGKSLSAGMVYIHR